MCGGKWAPDAAAAATAGGARLPAVLLNDLYVFAPGTSTWRAVSPAGNLPAGRWTMGCQTTQDGALYVYGGGGYGARHRAGGGARRCFGLFGRRRGKGRLS